MTDLRPVGEDRLYIGDYFRLPWIFDKWYEKAILVFLSLVGLIKCVSTIL